MNNYKRFLIIVRTLQLLSSKKQNRNPVVKYRVFINLKIFIMSIQKVEMYTCICDNCGKSADEDTDYSCWNDGSIAKDVASNANWASEGDKDYCMDCYSYNDEDNIVLKNIQP